MQVLISGRQGQLLLSCGWGTVYVAMPCQAYLLRCMGVRHAGQRL